MTPFDAPIDIHAEMADLLPLLYAAGSLPSRQARQVEARVKTGPRGYKMAANALRIALDNARPALSDDDARRIAQLAVALQDRHRRDRAARETPDVPDVRAWREAHGLTQQELADLLDYPSVMTISRWETGASPMANPTVIALALEALARRLG